MTVSSILRATTSCRRIVPQFLLRQIRLMSIIQRTTPQLLSSSSSLSSSRLLLRVDPSTLIQGLTREKVEKDPDTLAFLQANYPEAFDPDPAEDEEEEDVDDDSDVEDEINGQAESSFFSRESADTSSDKHPLNIRPLYCYQRDPLEESNSRRSRYLRWRNMIPGLLHGGNPTLGIYSHLKESKAFIKTDWRVLQRELDRYHRNFESRVYDLTIYQDKEDDDGTMHRVIPASVQRHPVKETIYCCNFVRYHAGRPLKIPVSYINQEESPSLKRGGFIIPIQKKIEVFIDDGVAIPEFLEVESTGLSLAAGNIVRKDRVLLPDGVHFSDRVVKRGDDFIIGVVQDVGRDGGEDGADEGDDEDEEASA